MIVTYLRHQLCNLVQPLQRQNQPGNAQDTEYLRYQYIHLHERKPLQGMGLLMYPNRLRAYYQLQYYFRLQNQCQYHRRYNKQIQQLAESCCQSPLQQWCSVTLSRSHVTRHLYTKLCYLELFKNAQYRCLNYI